MSELPILRDNEAWLDLNDGERAITRGKLTSIFTGSSLDKGHGIIVSFPDWSSFSFTCDDAEGARHSIGSVSNEEVCVLARRTEDGMHALAIWKPGGPPVPLSKEEPCSSNVTPAGNASGR